MSGAPINPTKSNNLAVPRPQHSYSTSLASNISPQHFLTTSNSSNNNIAKTNSRSGLSSAYRLSRSNTNTTSDAYLANLDNQSLQSIDQIPSAKPSVTYSDKLWTQIDVLDDVKRMADESKIRDRLFNEKYTEQLAKLKESQDQLLQTMSALQIEDTNTNEVQKQQLYQLKTTEIEGRGVNATDDTAGPSRNDNHSESSHLSETNQDSDGKESTTSNKEIELSVKEQAKIDKFFAAHGEEYNSNDDEEDDFQSQTIYKKEVFDEINRYVQQVKQDLRGLSDAMKECTSSGSSKDRT
ncbi:hypothetical protein KGF57_001339 [Candida theae]|uniref:Uncharacterized protein n=1 Tax=Candida theae TaxID=1198502 RepID=A0AAD5BH76_9ASCO|nr:uncharacterized protein KGF57_001339 [Candida theae]KAI5962899.1 hypothetical protein KGF57_001339 [Candida theae]